MAGVRRGAFACVGSRVAGNTVIPIPYGKRRPVALRWGSHEELYRPLPFTFLLPVSHSPAISPTEKTNRLYDCAADAAGMRRKQTCLHEVSVTSVSP